MTEKHPLTKEMLDNIAPWPIKRLPGEYTTMRTVADWQLQQVIEWLYSNINVYDFTLSGCGAPIDVDDIVKGIKEDLRPQ